MKSLGYLILGLPFTWYGILNLPTNIQGSTIALIIGLLMIGYFTKNHINKVDNNYKK